jgi:hypothetical protein
VGLGLVATASSPSANRLTKLSLEVMRQSKELQELQGMMAGQQPRPTPETKTVGNVVCLPGVSLATVRRSQRRKMAAQGGDDPGPSAA